MKRANKQFIKLTFKTATGTYPLYIRPELIAVVEGYSSSTSIVVLKNEVSKDFKKEGQELRSYLVGEQPEEVMRLMGE